jgi:hypothetical protein
MRTDHLIDDGIMHMILWFFGLFFFASLITIALSPLS